MKRQNLRAIFCIGNMLNNKFTFFFGNLPLIAILKMPSTLDLILKILKFKHKLVMELITENKEQLIMLKISIQVVDFSQNCIIIFPAMTLHVKNYEICESIKRVY